MGNREHDAGLAALGSRREYSCGQRDNPVTTMYTDEWEPVMTAETMEEKISEFAALAQARTEDKEKPVEDVVHKLTHDSYLMKHTVADVLTELQELQALYQDEFYNGDANSHIMDYVEDSLSFDFWYDYVYLSLAAGMEWAVLQEVEEKTSNVASEP